MEKVIPKGEEVLIFRDKRKYGLEEDDTKFVRGRVISNGLSDDMSYHGSPWYLAIYKVLGDNNQEYKCTYETPFISISDYYIRTIDDYIEHIDYIVKEKKHTISEIRKSIKELQNIKNSLIEENKTKTLKK